MYESETRYSKPHSQTQSQSQSQTLDFSSEPSSKIAPVVVGGAVFLGRAIAGGAIGGAASWATTRILNNRFPQSSSGR
jgi:hypothetical protein